ncbi:MAG: hypothetical protein QXJ55_10345 [Candidatus Caldarchaeum sp.]
MRREEKWTLPVVYVPRGEDKHLLDIVYEVVELEDVTVVFLWFHWSHDKPFSDNPEYEPLAIAFHDGWPKLVFYRPHYMHRISKPMLAGRKAVVYVSKLGHAPTITKWEVLLNSLTVKYKKLKKSFLERKMLQGQPPTEFLILLGVNFREWVLEQLKRPEILKSVRRRKSNGVLRLFWHVLMAARAGGRGDLEKLYRHLLMAFIAMPANMKVGPFGKYILENACDVKKLLKNNARLSDEQKTDVKEYWLAFIPEIIRHHISTRMSNDQREHFLREITALAASLKTT